MSNNLSKSDIETMIKEFDGSERFFNLGTEIFGIIGYPRSPLNADRNGVHKMLKKLDKLDAPLFYKYMFFNSKSLAPIFQNMIHYINEAFKIYEGRWIEDGLPVNSLNIVDKSHSEPPNPPARSTSRGRVVDGKYKVNDQYSGNTSGRSGSRSSSGQNKGWKSSYDVDAVKTGICVVKILGFSFLCNIQYFVFHHELGYQMDGICRKRHLFCFVAANWLSSISSYPTICFLLSFAMMCFFFVLYVH